MPYFESGRGRLHYRRWPVVGAGAVVALLPGSGQHSGHYHRFAKGLGEAGVELWALDTAGQGLSEGEGERPGTLRELCGDAAGFVAEVREGARGPVVLMGHSLGAATALGALDSGLVGIPAGLVVCGTPQTILRGEPPKSARGAGAGAGWTGAAPRLPAGLPVLVVHGVDDRRTPIDPVREWARTAGAEFREYADAGHDLLHEPVQGEVTADIAGWIGRMISNR